MIVMSNNGDGWRKSKRKVETSKLINSDRYTQADRPADAKRKTKLIKQGHGKEVRETNEQTGRHIKIDDRQTNEETDYQREGSIHQTRTPSP